MMGLGKSNAVDILHILIHSLKSQSRSPSQSTLKTVITQHHIAICLRSSADFYFTPKKYPSTQSPSKLRVDFSVQVIFFTTLR